MRFDNSLGGPIDPHPVGGSLTDDKLGSLDAKLVLPVRADNLAFKTSCLAGRC